VIAASVLGIVLVLGLAPWVVRCDGFTFPYPLLAPWRWPAVWLWNASEVLRLPLPRIVAPRLFGVIMGSRPVPPP